MTEENEFVMAAPYDLDDEGFQTALKQGLNEWIEKQGWSLQMFADHLDVGYQHAWGLARGARAVSTKMMGEFLVTFGIEALGEWMSCVEDVLFAHVDSLTEGIGE